MQSSTYRLYFICCLICSLVFGAAAKAQFRGGNDDGISTAFSINQLLGQNIFIGGADDGISFSFSPNQALGQNIFTGGIDDGFSFSYIPSTPLGQNIFTGGLDDGFSFSYATAQALGQNIFTGGNDDGNAVSSAVSQSLGQNIFTGGDNDGWAFAIGNNLVLVPVVLKTFEAQWKNEEDVLTRWITSSEANTKHFEIERSINGISFETSGNIPAAGNSSLERTYTFTDINPNKNYTSRPTHFYYRLKTVDLDGKLSYSAIVVLPNKQTEQAEMFVLYPNPARQFIIVEFKNTISFKPKLLQLFSNDGKMMMQKLMINAKETIQVGHYSSGSYFLQLTDTNTRSTQSLKFIIQH